MTTVEVMTEQAAEVSELRPASGPFCKRVGQNFYELHAATVLELEVLARARNTVLGTSEQWCPRCRVVVEAERVEDKAGGDPSWVCPWCQSPVRAPRVMDLPEDVIQVSKEDGMDKEPAENCPVTGGPVTHFYKRVSQYWYDFHSAKVWERELLMRARNRVYAREQWCPHCRVVVDAYAVVRKEGGRPTWACPWCHNRVKKPRRMSLPRDIMLMAIRGDKERSNT